MTRLQAHFGGPDLPRGALLELLRERVRALPAGGALHWVTYYLRHRGLVEDLLEARARGVEVRVAVEGRPRSAGANRAALEKLAGLGPGLRVVDHRAVPGVGWRPHLHEKLYWFSHPEPAALVGSYNPANDEPEDDPAFLASAGDLDRGHNALVEIRDPAVVAGLRRHAHLIHGGRHGLSERVWRRAYPSLRGEGLDVHFWPRTGPHPVLALLRSAGAGARIRMAASHVSGSTAVRALADLARRGARLEIVGDVAGRRMPERVVARLREAGVTVRRPELPPGVPMHHKFVLVEGAGGRRVVFGSLNWTGRSHWLSHELAAVSEDAGLWAAFEERWAALGGGD